MEWRIRNTQLSVLCEIIFNESVQFLWLFRNLTRMETVNIEKYKNAVSVLSASRKHIMNVCLDSVPMQFEQHSTDCTIINKVNRLFQFETIILLFLSFFITFRNLCHHKF